MQDNTPKHSSELRNASKWTDAITLIHWLGPHHCDYDISPYMVSHWRSHDRSNELIS